MHSIKTGERLQHFLYTMNLTVYRFEVETGLSVSAAVRVIQGKQEFSTANLQRIYKRYPELNLDWFLTGRGEMLVDTTKLNSSDYLKDLIQALEQKIENRKEVEFEILQSRRTLEKQLLALKSEAPNLHVDDTRN